MIQLDQGLRTLFVLSTPTVLNDEANYWPLQLEQIVRDKVVTEEQFLTNNGIDLKLLHDITTNPLVLTPSPQPAVCFACGFQHGTTRIPKHLTSCPFCFYVWESNPILRFNGTLECARNILHAIGKPYTNDTLHWAVTTFIIECWTYPDAWLEARKMKPRRGAEFCVDMLAPVSNPVDKRRELRKAATTLPANRSGLDAYAGFGDGHKLVEQRHQLQPPNDEPVTQEGNFLAGLIPPKG